MRSIRKRTVAVLMALAVMMALLGALVLPSAAALSNYQWVTQVSNTASNFFGATAADMTHVWGIGQNHTIDFFDGTAWATQTNPATSSFFNGIHAFDASHVWAVGEDKEVLFYNGTSWAVQVAQTSSNEDGYSVDMVNATRGWLVGADTDTNTDVVYQTSDGSTWTSENMGVSTLLRGVTALDASHVWATGYDNASSDGRTYFRDGTGWNTTPQDTVTGVRLRAVYAADATHVWAVGNGGAIRFFNGTTWAPAPGSGTITTDDLYAVNGTDANHVWASGNNGTIVFWNGSAWTKQTVPTVNSLRGIAPVGGENVWAAGRTGTIVYGVAQYQPVVTTKLTPTYGATGTLVTVTGLDFTNARGSSCVWLGSSKVTNYVSWYDNQIKFTVPNGAYGTRSLQVCVNNNWSNKRTFDVRPTFTNIYPTSGKAGSTLEIYGSAFGNSMDTSVVYFGSKAATSFVSWQNTRIKVKVPTGVSGTVPVKVVTSGGPSWSWNFTVKP